MNVQAIGATENTLQAVANDLDTLQAIRRIIVLLESQANVDAGGRQRIAVDAFAPAATLGTVANVGSLAGYDHHQFIDVAQSTFANAIRSKLN